MINFETAAAFFSATALSSPGPSNSASSKLSITSSISSVTVPLGVDTKAQISTGIPSFLRVPAAFRRSNTPWTSFSSSVDAGTPAPSTSIWLTMLPRQPRIFRGGVTGMRGTEREGEVPGRAISWRVFSDVPVRV